MSIRQVLAAVALCALVAAQAQTPVPLPNKVESLHITVISDNGTGEDEEYETATQLAKAYDRFNFPLVLMMGNNLYGSERPQDFKDKFEAPYKALTDKGVKFYASLG